jgi:isocitrate dehydrogenase
MAEKTPETHEEFEELIVGLYNILYEDDLTTDDIEFYELEEEHYEGEIYLPYIGLNVDLWQEWSIEKRVEVLIHEFAHTENYEDDHHPDFWERVVELTEISIDYREEIEALFGGEPDPDELKETVVESIHEYVIESDIDSVETRKREVSDALELPADRACSD